MGKYRVEYTPTAIKQLRKLDVQTRKLIYAWIDKNLQNCENPRAHGKGLTADRSGQWRYRIGKYRLLAEINETEIVILILRVGHRNDIYKNI